MIAATHRDLEEMILQKQFRSDLYYRLNVFPISIPPLRNDAKDIPLLVQHFVRQAARRMNQTIDTIPSETMDALTQYRWPGNIRELENVIERAVILSPGSVLHVPLRDLQSRIAVGHDSERLETLADVERQHIRSILKETRWVLFGTERCCGATRSESFDALFPHEEAGNRTPLGVTPMRTSIRRPGRFPIAAEVPGCQHVCS